MVSPLKIKSSKRSPPISLARPSKKEPEIGCTSCTQQHLSRNNSWFPVFKQHFTPPLLCYHCVLQLWTKYNKYFLKVYGALSEFGNWSLVLKQQPTAQKSWCWCPTYCFKTIRGGEAGGEAASDDAGSSLSELSWQLTNYTNAPLQSHLGSRERQKTNEELDSSFRAKLRV